MKTEGELKEKIDIIRGKQNVLTPHACYSTPTVCMGICVCILCETLQYACLYYAEWCNLPSVSLFPGQCCTSPNPQLWGSLWGSQTGWQCQSPGMLARQHTWEPAQRAHACGIWRKRRSPGHFSIQQKAHISCLTFYTRTQTHTLSSNKGFVVNVPINLKNRETVA